MTAINSETPDSNLLEIPDVKYRHELILLNTNKIHTVSQFEKTYRYYKSTTNCEIISAGGVKPDMCAKYLALVDRFRQVTKLDATTDDINNRLHIELLGQLPDLITRSKNIATYLKLLGIYDIYPAVRLDHLHNVFEYSIIKGIYPTLNKYANSFTSSNYNPVQYLHNIGYENVIDEIKTYVNSSDIIPLLRVMSGYVENMQSIMHVLDKHSPLTMLTTDPEFVKLAELVTRYAS